MKFEHLLKEEIVSEVESLGKLELGTEQYKTTVDGVTKLVDRALEIEKIDIEAEERERSREIETNLKIQQIEDDRKDRKVKNGIAIGSTLLGVAVTVWGTLKTLKFEEEGTVTTLVGRGFINKLLPKKWLSRRWVRKGSSFLLAKFTSYFMRTTVF